MNIKNTKWKYTIDFELAGEPVKLLDCPAGTFLYEGKLCIKHVNTNFWPCDHEGQPIEFNKGMVQPIAITRYTIRPLDMPRRRR